MIYLITEACPNATGFFNFCMTGITLLNPGRHALIPGSKQSVTEDAAMDYLPPFVAVPILLIYSCGTSFLIAKVSNYLKKKRNDKLFLYWDKDIQLVEVYIEAYGLGTMMAEKRDKESIEVPYDILEELAKRYDLDPSDLLKGFVKGLEVGTRA